MSDYEPIESFEQAKFNMALDTLKRLGEILREIKMVESSIIYSKEEKQQVKVSLVKQLFYQSTPLLDLKFVEKHRVSIVALRTSKIKIFERHNYGENKYMGIGNKYDPDLDDKLDNILIDIQIELQKKGHFMPPSDESSLF